ncbi:MAG: hypothetical protein LBD09_07015 [Treponema sp.]|jgi:hypothetical protein|nr:hypothetical protein [Treponema sp.]
MFSQEFFSFLIKVITSWQIIAVTVALIFYLTIVSYAARMYRPVKFSFDSKPKKEKKEKPEEAALPEESGGDDLGLEE